MTRKEALSAASDLVGIVHMGRGQYVLQYPWRGHSGPVTNSPGSHAHGAAMQARAALVAQYALEMLHPDCDSDYAINRATDGGWHYGRARDILSRALCHV